MYADARVLEELVFQQLANVLCVNELSFCFIRNDNLDSSLLKYFGIKSRPHGESRSHKPGLLQAERLCVCGSRAHDADQRNRGTALHFLEDQMWRIGGHETEVGAGVHQALYT